MKRLPEQIRTARLTLRPWRMEEAALISRLSLDESNRRFLPDEVFETPEDARNVLGVLLPALETAQGPYVYAMVLDGTPIGHVEAAQLGGGAWEIGFHLGEAYRGCGYAAEAVRAFAPEVMAALSLPALAGICCAENTASARVMERCGFTLVREAVGPYQGVLRPLREYTLTL